MLLIFFREKFSGCTLSTKIRFGFPARHQIENTNTATNSSKNSIYTCVKSVTIYKQFCCEASKLKKNYKSFLSHHHPIFSPIAAAHNMLLAHAKAWHIYDKEFRPNQNGKITIVLESEYFVPKTESEADKQAAYRGMVWSLGWLADPVFKGDYPEMMKKTIEEKSRAKGLPCR